MRVRKEFETAQKSYVQNKKGKELPRPLTPTHTQKGAEEYELFTQGSGIRCKLDMRSR